MNNKLPIKKIDMLPRTKYCLMRRNVRDLHELSNYTQEDIRNIPNVGDKTYVDILNTCEKYNVDLKDLQFKLIMHIYECIFTIYNRENKNDTTTLTQLVIAHNEDEVKVTINESWNYRVYDTMKIKRLELYNGLIL